MFHRKYRVMLCAVFALDLLLAASILLQYADSHALLSEAALRQGSVLYFLISWIETLSFFIFVLPYTVFFAVYCLIRQKALLISEHSRAKLRFAISFASAILLSLILKYLTLLSIAAEALFPYQFHV